MYLAAGPLDKCQMQPLPPLDPIPSLSLPTSLSHTQIQPKARRGGLVLIGGVTDRRGVK